MGWIETGRLSLPKDALVAEGVFHQGAYFFRMAPRWNQKTHLFGWDATAKSELWRVEISERCDYLGAVGPYLLLRERPAYGVKPRRHRLSAINPKDGSQAWSDNRMLRAFSASGDRIYAIEKPLKKPFQLVCYNGESGKAMRTEMAYEAFQELWATDALLIGRHNASFYALDLSGELLDQVDTPGAMRAVGPDGSVYYYEYDSKEGHMIRRWQPQTKELWDLSTGDFGVSLMVASKTPGLLFYSQQTKQTTKLRFVLYDWNQDRKCWDIESDLGKPYPFARLFESALGYFAFSYGSANFFFEPKTGAPKGLSHSPNPVYLCVGERVFLQQKQNLIALLWKS